MHKTEEKDIGKIQKSFNSTKQWTVHENMIQGNNLVTYKSQKIRLRVLQGI